MELKISIKLANKICWNFGFVPILINLLGKKTTINFNINTSTRLVILRDMILSVVNGWVKPCVLCYPIDFVRCEIDSECC